VDESLGTAPEQKNTVTPDAPGRPAPSRAAALWRSVAVLLIAAAVLFLVGLLLGLFVVGRHGGGPIQPWDDTVERWFIHHRGPLVGVSKWVATYLDALPLGIEAGALTLVLLATLRTVRALVPIAAYFGGELQVFVIREIILRHRPPTANFPAPGAIPGVHETSYSYPSGHSVAVTAILFALAVSLALWRRSWWPFVVLAAVGSLFVIDTRLVLGVHWFSDVVFGWLLGVTWGIVVSVVLRRLEWTDVKAGLGLSGRSQKGELPRHRRGASVPTAEG
jgi:membrane-associated phospholipid phosphatase